MQLAEILERFDTFLSREGIPHLVVGGLAMHAWGLSRATRDVDFVVPRVAQGRVVDHALGEGFETLHLSAGYSNHYRETDGARADFMYVDDETAAKLFASAVERPIIGDLRIAVPSPEHMIAMKLAAIRNDSSRRFRDLEDIGHLMRLDVVDRAAVRDFFERYGMLADFDELTRAHE